MAKRIRVSRQGLTPCPGCHTHIKLSAQVEETSCPFCQTTILVEAAPSGVLALARSLAGSKSGLLAASLFGLSLAACAGTPDNNNNNNDGQIVQDASPDSPNQALYGAIPADRVATEPAPDQNTQPLYGAVPPDAGEVSQEPTPDGQNQSLYGLPAPDQP